MCHWWRFFLHSHRGNEHRFTVTLMNLVRRSLPSNIRLYRQTSSWNSSATMRSILSILALCLSGIKIVLLLDCASCHMEFSVASHAARLGIVLIFIPAKLTYLLQPCDSHWFAKFKKKLRVNFQLKVLSHGHPLSTHAWLCAIIDTITQTICAHHWSEAFRANGILDNQRFLRPTILEQMYGPG